MSSYYEELVNIFFNSMGGIVAIRHYNNFQFDLESMERARKEGNSAVILYKDFHVNDIPGPFDPFLQWIKDLCAQNNIEHRQLLEECEVYSMHQEVFGSYFEKGLCVRTENPLLNEVGFEKQLFMDEVIRMLTYLAGIRPLCILLENVSVAGYSTLALLRQLIELRCENISIIGAHDENEAEVDSTKKIWESLVEYLETHDLMLDIMGEAKEVESAYHSRFKYSNHELEEYYTTLTNLYYFMCYEQAEHYLNIIYHKFEVEKIKVTAENKFKFLMLYATNTMFLEKGAEALLYLNGMQQCLGDLEGMIWQVQYHRMAARINMYNYQQEIATEHIKECRKFLKEMDDPFFTFKIDLLEHMVFFQGWRSIWLLNSTIKGLDNLIENCIKYGYDNHLAHIYVYAFDNEKERYSNLAGLNIKMPHFLKGVQLAKKIGNYYFMLEAYKKSVLMASTNGFYHTANYFNERIRDLSIKYKDFLELAKNYNGMGYNCCVTENYEQACEHYNNALEVFMRENNMESVNETIYNLAVNALLAMDYAKADHLFQLCLKCIALIKSNSVNVCNISKIYGLRAFCNFMLGQYYHTMINLQYVEQFLGHIIALEDQNVDAPHLWDDDLAIFYTVYALLDNQNGLVDSAYRNLQKGRKFIDRAAGSKFMFFCPYALAYARIAKKCGKDQEAADIIFEARRYCRESNFKKRAELIRVATAGEELPIYNLDIGIKVVTEREILEKAEYIGMSKGYKSQKADLEFLGIWQKTLSGNSQEMDRVLGNAFVTLMNQYNLDDFLFIRMEDERPVLKYKNTESEITEEILWYIVDYFNESRSAFKTSRLDKGYTRYQQFINKCFGFNSINTFIAVPIFSNERLNSIFLASVQMNMEWNYKSKRYIFDNDDLAVFVMIYHNVVDYLERMEAQKAIAKANNRLKNMAVKDQLTGLYNRQGLDEIFRGSFDQIAIIYADLDNFKYYNDTFGHDVGDKVLVEFSKLLGNVTAQRADAVRYGGDEFLLIMYTDEREDVETAVQNIYKKLRESDGLTIDISRSLGYDLEIPEDKQLSCSIGIAMGEIEGGQERKAQIDQILKRADTMMYKVKHTTKHTYTFFE